MPINIPFIPQEGITQGILSAIQLANEHSAQQKTAQIQAQNAATAQQEAQTAASRLTAEKPEIAARTANLGANTALTQADLDQRKATTAFFNGTSDAPANDPAHVDQLTTQIAGPHAQQLDVSNPVGQTLAAPQAPPPDGSQPTAQPAAPAQKYGVHQYIDALDKKVGLLPEERSAIENAAQLAAATHDMKGFQTQVEGIVGKRNDPAYARFVALRQQGLTADAAHQKIASIDATNAALTKIGTDPNELTGDKAVSAVEQLKGMLRDKDLDPAQKPRVQSLLTTAELAVKSNLAFDAAKKRADKAAQDGDPVAAGKLLANGDAAPNEITTGRNSAFAVAAFNEAKKLNPNWTASSAQAEFDQAKSPTNLGFFGSAKSLTDPGGTLDQLITQGKRLDNGKLQAINSVDNAVKFATGGGPQAHYAATVLGVSDDLAKVLGGGTGTDSSRAEAKALVNSALAQNQREEAVAGIRDAVDSQMSSRIGTNSVMRKTFGKGVSEGPSTGGPKVGDSITQNGHTYTVRAVANGKVTQAD